MTASASSARETKIALEMMWFFAEWIKNPSSAAANMSSKKWSTSADGDSVGDAEREGEDDMAACGRLPIEKVWETEARLQLQTV